VKAVSQDLEKQFTLQLRLVQALQQANQAVEDIHTAAQAGKISADDERKLAGARPRRGAAESAGGQQQPPAFAAGIGNLAQLIVAVDSADAAPTAQESEAADKAISQVQALFRQWEALKPK
jgi:hypothetical protein